MKCLRIVAVRGGARFSGPVRRDLSRSKNAVGHKCARGTQYETRSGQISARKYNYGMEAGIGWPTVILINLMFFPND